MEKVNESQPDVSTLPPDQLTFGQKAAGVSFNPGGNPDVDFIKREFAHIIDFCNAARQNCSGEKARYFSKAISFAEDAQMNAVKAITWSH